MALLGGLLPNAGLRVEVREIVRLARNPLVVLVGTAPNLLVPLAFVLLLFQGLRWWHDPEPKTILPL